jgi:hypothetical protein
LVSIMDLEPCLLIWCTNNKCRCKCTNNLLLTLNLCLLEPRLKETKPHHLAGRPNILRLDLQTKMVKGMRRKTRTTLLKNQVPRRETRLSKRSTSPSKRRTKTTNLLPRLPPTKSLLKT